jgi:LysR family transcriptional activator of nhaA
MYSEGDMEWLNYHHLLYFWTVAKEGSIARACEKLRLAQPTISGQIRQLEASLGERLFRKQGRGLALTEIGQVVLEYADEIFGLGRELQDVLQGRPRGRPARVRIGISDMLPKLITYRILRPILDMPDAAQIVCDEDTPDNLLRQLADHRIDVMLSDAPIPPNAPVKAFHHLLGSSVATVFGVSKLAARYRRNFPASLNGAPFLLPIEGSALRRSLDQWFDAQQIRPRIVGEFQDRALMKAFGQGGAGLFAAPAAIEREILTHYRVGALGRIDAVVERFYAVSPERKLKHPAVVKITETARETLFGAA